MDRVLKEGWEYGILENAVKKGSSNISLNKIKDDDGDYPLFGAKGFVKNISFFQQEKEYLAIIKDGAGIGRISKHPKNSSIIGTMQYLIPKVGFDIDFVKYFLHSIDFEKHRNGSTIPHIYFKDYKSEPFPILKLQEQKRIVAILDEAFFAIEKAKANAERNLAHAKELFESYLQSVFENRGEDWEEKTLSDVCEITSKLIDPKKEEFHNLIHIGAGNIESQKGTLIDLKTAKEENLISGKFLFDETMVLYSKIRPYLMKVIRCNFQGLCSADIYPLVPIKNEITQDFLYHILLSNHFTEYAIEGSQRAGMPKVNRKHLFEYTFYCPPIEEQQTIVKKLDTLSEQTKKLEKIYKQKIKDLDELKKSILQKAFNGEL
ncbi:MAG: restriction endonuclease subunit S [Sulfurimonas sp.]|nr:restriction endonuclease subunit S [Sulfurimonas sp.]MCW9068027.1 restriction endonuclease subunit S [Sulfurimonas sp.]